MKKTKGNFLTQADRDFPLDCETLDNLQELSWMAQVAGNAAGDRTVLAGCEPSADGTRRAPGYVFLRTHDRPDGEVLWFEGGAASAGTHVAEEAVGVTADGREYPAAYTRRWLAAGTGAESYRWEDFAEARSTRELAEENAALRARLELLSPPPLGTVQLWAGRGVPAGHALCDGRQLAAADYPELYAAVGAAFNTAASAEGAAYTTPEGYFRLPDLRGRFVVGMSDTDKEYAAAGAAGGLKKVALAAGEMPGHAHRVRDYYYAQAQSSMTNYKVERYDTVPRSETGNNGIGAAASDTDNDCLPYYEHETYAAGEGASHENRPPYYALAYVMRLR